MSDAETQSDQALTKGERTRERLFQAAVQRFCQEGYGAASMRAIARSAEVTPALLYRYFPSKDAIVAELYGRSLAAWAERAAELPPGTWAERALWLTRLAFEVLGPYRTLLRVLVPAMLEGDPVASPLRNQESRQVASPAFRDAVASATDAPGKGRVEPVAELAYLGHLGLILFWVNDDSEGLAETERLLGQVGKVAPWLKLGLATPVVGRHLFAIGRTLTRSLAKEA